jgi:NAD+ kinase
METFAVFARRHGKVDEVRRVAESMGFRYDPADPDVVISVGGDGTFLYAERQTPGVPKLLVRDSLVCYKCHNEPLDQVLQLIREGDFRLMESPKLRVRCGAWKHLAANDVVVRNSDPRHALRFRLARDKREAGDTLIGDGIVAATPFGSTGYFRSVSRHTVAGGFGVAFNNLTEPREPLQLGVDTTVHIEIVRGTARVAVDNHDDTKRAGRGASVEIGVAEDHRVRLMGHT